MPVAEVLRLRAIPRGGQAGIDGGGLICIVRLLVDTHEAMETDREVRHSDGLHHGQDDRALHQVAGGVSPVRLIRADVKIGQVARASPQRQRQPGEQRPAGRGRTWRRRRRRWRSIRAHALSMGDDDVAKS